MTEAQYELIRFTLGVVGSRKNPSRNAIATGPEETTWNDTQIMEAHGFLFKGAKIPGKLSYYHATTAGIAVAKLTFEEVSELAKCLYPTLLEMGGAYPPGPPDISGEEAPAPDLSGDPSETGDSQEYETEVAAAPPPPERPAPKRRPKAKPQPEPEPEDQTQELAYMEE